MRCILRCNTLTSEGFRLLPIVMCKEPRIPTPGSRYYTQESRTKNISVVKISTINKYLKPVENFSIFLTVLLQLDGIVKILLIPLLMLLKIYKFIFKKNFIAL